MLNIVIKKSKVHGHGAFALRDIKKGEKVIEYVGEKVTKAEGDRRAELVFERSKKDPKKGAVYIFELNSKYDIDGDVPENIAKFINHSCDPNCKVDIIKGRIWVVAKKNIKEGEEINYNYCYHIDDCLNHPCKCGSKNCVGYIVASRFRKKVLKILNG